MEKIPLRNGHVSLKEDIIVLSKSQIQEILDVSHTKTDKEWIEAKQGVKITLSEEQMEDVLKVKNEIVEGLNAKDLIESDFIDMLPHAMKRAIERLEGLEAKAPYHLAMRRETYEKIAQALIDSDMLDRKAEWKGGEYLRYNFKSKVDDNDLTISISFEDTMLVITVIVTNKKGFFSHEHPEFAKLKGLF